jgi:hypothetical protein
MPAEPALKILALLAATGAACLAGDLHDHNANLWLTYSGNHPVSGPWGIHFDTQIRRAEFGDEWQQLLIRPGIQYTLNDQVTFAAGYAYVNTYPYGDFPAPDDFPEHRTWEQVSVRTPFLGLDWTHRLRLEQRFIGTFESTDIGTLEVTDYRYENRFRYLLRTMIPLSASRKTHLILWDEVFINFGGEVMGNTFDQNRFFIGIGQTLGRGFRLEAGFMEQTVQRRGGRIWEHNHTLALYLVSNSPLFGSPR